MQCAKCNNTQDLRRCKKCGHWWCPRCRNYTEWCPRCQTYSCS